MLAQSGGGGGVPRPRKPRPAASTIAVPMLRVAWTMIGARPFGRTRRPITPLPRAPTPRAASTNSPAPTAGPAAIAMSPTRTSRVAPSIPVAERRKRRRAATHRDGAACAPASTGDGTAVALAPAISGVPDTRIQNRVHQVNDEADDDDEQGDNDDRRLHDGVVTRRDGVQNVTADTNSAEYRVGGNRPAEKRRELQPDEAHDGTDVAHQRVTTHYLP